MTHTNLITRLASVLAVFIAIVGFSAVGTPAYAYYGAVPGNALGSVCAGRYDPNCILKETAYEDEISAPYTQWHYQTPVAPVLPQTYGVPYVSAYTPTYYPTTQYVSYPSYSYQYSYQYAYPSTYYVAPTTYYVAPTYSYDDSYDNSTYDSSDYNYDYNNSCDSYSYNCSY